MRSGALDPDFIPRLLEASLVFRRTGEASEGYRSYVSREDPPLEDEPPLETSFEGHLVRLLPSAAAPDRILLMVDGEPSGEIDGWPPGWRRLSSSRG